MNLQVKETTKYIEINPHLDSGLVKLRTPKEKEIKKRQREKTEQNMCKRLTISSRLLNSNNGNQKAVE